MGLMFRLLMRPVLSIQDSEKAHSRIIRLLRFFTSNPITRFPIKAIYKPKKELPVKIFGSQYIHPFGLAAGMDKKAEAIRGWETLGVGFIEIGGVTKIGQEGNPKPRMFRSYSSKSLINRMGFNNPGSEKMRLNLMKHFEKFGKPNIPLWINLGKSKVTPLDKAHEDYSSTFELLWEFGDVFVINVSSPNTPNLRDLQNDKSLERIIQSCQKINEKMATKNDQNEKPILIKIAPELDDEQLKAVVETARKNDCKGIVATNTTTSRPDSNSKHEELVFMQEGGLSGLPLKDISTEFISKIYNMTEGNWPIIGVGGIMNADDAWDKITAGATLLQAYSGFVFEGASISKSIVNGLQQKLDEHGLSKIEEAVGLAHR